MSAAENYVPESSASEAHTPKQGLIPEGDYAARGARAEGELGETSTGKPYVRVLLRLLDGEYRGRLLVKDLYFTEKTWERSIQSLQAMGWKGEDISQTDGLDANEVSIAIEQKVQTDRDGAIRTDAQGNALYRNEIAWINGGVRRMEAAKKLSFVEEMKAKVRQLANDNGTAAPGTPAKSAAPTAAEKLKAQVAAKTQAKKSAKALAPAPAPEPEELGDAYEPPPSGDDIPF